MIYPKHIAIIADGNRTWAKNQGMTAMDGHLAGAQNTVELFNHIFTTTPVEVVTGRFLSTENLQKRSAAELEFIFGIYKIMGKDLDELLEKHHINFKRVGNPEGIPEDFKSFLEERTKRFSFTDTNRYVILALNYGGRDEIIRGVQKMVATGITDITEENLSKSMDLGDVPPVELVVRTKGDEAQRTSGFMAWRIGYAELFFSPQTYPDYKSADLDETLVRFNEVADKRNYGS